jgi:hypothetical protein
MRSSSRPSSTASALESLDALFREAGLKRNPHRPRPRGIRLARLDRHAPEELAPPRPALLRAPNGVQWLPIPGWDFPWLWSGFSTRKGGLTRAYCVHPAPAKPALPGELNLGFTAEDRRETVLANRRLFAEAVTGDAETPILALKQIHSHLVVDATSADAALSAPRRADGQITAEPGQLLAVQIADCIPVLVADRRQRIVAAFHSGWRGTVKRIVETGVGRMRLLYGSRPRDLVAAIGPGVSACCYAVGEEVLSEFESQFTYARQLFHEVFSSDAVKTKYPMLFLTQRAPGHSPIGPSLHLDLVQANRRQLLDSGLAPRSIRIVGGCTQCHTDLFFSHRASQGRAGRMMAVIGIRKETGPDRE